MSGPHELSVRWENELSEQNVFELRGNREWLTSQCQPSSTNFTGHESPQAQMEYTRDLGHSSLSQQTSYDCASASVPGQETMSNVKRCLSDVSSMTGGNTPLSASSVSPTTPSEPGMNGLPIFNQHDYKILPNEISFSLSDQTWNVRSGYSPRQIDALHHAQQHSSINHPEDSSMMYSNPVHSCNAQAVDLQAQSHHNFLLAGSYTQSQPVTQYQFQPHFFDLYQGEHIHSDTSLTNNHYEMNSNGGHQLDRQQITAQSFANANENHAWTHEHVELAGADIDYSVNPIGGNDTSYLPSGNGHSINDRQQTDIYHEEDCMASSVHIALVSVETNRYAPVQCPTCKSVFKGRYARANSKRHIESIHQFRRFPCQSCSKTYRRSDALFKHKEKKHPK